MKTRHFLILIILLISCRQKDKALIDFDPRSLTENEILLTDIADDIYYIPLDNSYPIGQIYDRIRFINNSIYFSAENIGVLDFNKEGKFLRKVGSMGRGPGEYTFVGRVAIDDKTETVYILDNGNIIKVFSQSGKFIRSFNLKEYGDMINAIEIYNSKLFATFSIQYENADYEWIAFDTLGNLIDKKNRYSTKFNSNALPLAGIYKYENLLTYWNNYSDTIFSILPDLNSKPSFIVSLGDHRLPKSKITVENMSDYMWLQDIFESKQFIIIRYFFPLKKYVLVLLDKRNNKSFLINLKLNDSGTEWIGGIINDIDGGPRFLPKNYFIEDGREFLVGLTNPYQIKTIVPNNEFKNSATKYPEKKQELEKLANSLKETDNPVLMMVRLKK